MHLFGIHYNYKCMQNANTFGVRINSIANTDCTDWVQILVNIVTIEYSVDYYLNDSVVTVDEIITDTTNSPEPTTEDDDDYYEYETNNSDLVVMKNVNNVNKTLDTINRLSKIVSDLSKDLLSVKQLTQLAEIFFSIDIPSDCLLSLIEVVNGIRLIDSMGRIPTGIMEGTVSHFGEFDECLGIESPVNADTLSTQSLIRGQYCLAKIILPYPKKQPLDKRANKNISNKIYFDKLVAFLKNYNMDQYLTVFKLIEILNNQKGATFRFGTCIPSVCRPQDIENILNTVIYPITHMPIELMPDCYVKNEPKNLDNFQKMAICQPIQPAIQIDSVRCLRRSCLLLFADSGSKRFVCIDAIRFLLIINVVRCLRRSCLLLFADSGSKRFVCIDAIRFLLIINVCVDHILWLKYSVPINYRIQSDHNVFDFGPGFAICNPPTWFLSALFQLQVIAPISPKHLFGQKTYLDPLGISSLEEMTKAFVAFHMGINQYIISFFI
ncbi:unnamed protein product, partial [Medioppia subpectinata]